MAGLFLLAYILYTGFTSDSKSMAQMDNEHESLDNQTKLDSTLKKDGQNE